ncbi:PIN domain-containing protein [Microbacterium panaciterrae]|uniref:Ribonuclease VapC n=1 Tax=Microbacterium panaciterrae TaxID=985759 RepID=A0ABP8PCS2_9MICO
MIVVDTNIWSETLRDHPSPLVLAWMRRHHSEVFLPVVTRHELRVGVLQLPSGRRQDSLGALIDRMLERMSARTLPYDIAAAEAHARIRAAAHEAGRALSAEDGQILGIAAAHGASVATRNVRDFQAHGVPIIDPWTPPEP